MEDVLGHRERGERRPDPDALGGGDRVRARRRVRGGRAEEHRDLHLVVPVPLEGLHLPADEQGGAEQAEGDGDGEDNREGHPHVAAEPAGGLGEHEADVEAGPAGPHRASPELGAGRRTGGRRTAVGLGLGAMPRDGPAAGRNATSLPVGLAARCRVGWDQQPRGACPRARRVPDTPSDDAPRALGT